MNKRKLVLGGIGIFLAGLLVGGAGVAVFYNVRFAPVSRMDKIGPAAFFMERLDHVLKLSGTQRESIKPIVDDLVAQIREIRQPCLLTEDKALDSGAERIRALLDPEQQGKFTKFLEKAKERRKKFFGH